jgi:hypothetical protein
VVTTEDMLEKVAKIRYSYHVARDATKFLDLAKEYYLENKGEIEPLGKLIMDPTQWIARLYNSKIMNLLDIPHLEHGKKVGLCV